MRVTLSLLSAAALAAGAVSLAAAPASAINCPPGTRPHPITVGDRTVNICVPYQHCDPAACDVAVLP